MVFRLFIFSEFELIPSLFNSANLLKFRLCFCSAEWKSNVILAFCSVFRFFRIFIKFRTAIQSAFEWAIPLLLFIPRLSDNSTKFWNFAGQFFWIILFNGSHSIILYSETHNILPHNHKMFSARGCVYYDITTRRKQEPCDLEGMWNRVRV